MKTIKFFLLKGRDSLDISPIVGHPYGSCFKMTLSESCSKKKRLFNLEFAENVEDFEEMFLDDESGGTDNRNIFDAAAFTNNPDDVECSQKVFIQLLNKSYTEKISVANVIKAFSCVQKMK